MTVNVDTGPVDHDHRLDFRRGLKQWLRTAYQSCSIWLPYAHIGAASARTLCYSRPTLDIILKIPWT